MNHRVWDSCEAAKERTQRWKKFRIKMNWGINMTQFKLIAADLDGTLLDDRYTVLPELMLYINKARELGVEITVATGRLYPSALPFVRDLGVKLPVIASNGSVIKDPVTGTLVHQFTLDKSLAVEVLNMARNYEVHRFVNLHDVFYTDAPGIQTRRYSEALKVDFVYKDPLEEAITEDPIMVVLRGSDEEVARLTEIMRNHFGDRVYLANSKPFFIDVNHPGVSKGTGLIDLCQRINIKPEEVIAIGDGWNDLEMFQAAGLGAAVANAPDELKEHAGYVCSETTYKGVIEVIKNFVLK